MHASKLGRADRLCFVGLEPRLLPCGLHAAAADHYDTLLVVM